LHWLRSFSSSPSLRATFFLVIGGAGFAAANVLLARVLPPDEFGRVSLCLAIMQLGLTLGPLGLEVSINRRQLGASKTLLVGSLASGSVIGVVLAVVASHLYLLSGGLAFWLGVAAAAASINRVGGAFLQAQHRLGASLFLAQVHNYILLFVVPVVVLLGSNDSTLVVALVALGYVATAFAGWLWSLRLKVSRPLPGLGALLVESLAGLGIVLAVQVLWQLERLVVPRMLSMADLGVYAVVASIAGSPFRMIQIGIGYTLLPGLRSCRDLRQVRSLLWREGRMVGAAITASVVVVPGLTLVIAERFLHGRYEITGMLLAAVVITGLVKVWQAVASAAVQAFSTTTDMFALTVVSWLGVLAGVGGAVYGSRFGLPGLVFGVGLAWLIVSMAGSMLAVRGIRRWHQTQTAPIEARQPPAALNQD
jgi:O-antigen/teichoic acid export membrane protein